MYVWGHRGANTQSRFQNTLSSLSYGLETSHGLETDCVASANGTLYLIHDIACDKLKCIIHPDHHSLIGERHFDQLSDQEIETLYLNNGEKIPTLEHLLNTAKKFKNKTLNLELKGDHIANTVLSLVKDIGVGDNQIIFSSFNHPQLKELRTCDQDCEIGVLYGLYDYDRSPMFPWDQKSKAYYIPPRQEDIDLGFIKDIHAGYLHIEADSFIKHAYQYVPKDIPVTLWTMGVDVKAHEDKTLLEALSHKDIYPSIHAIIVDYPEEMCDVLRGRNLLTTPE